MAVDMVGTGDASLGEHRKLHSGDVNQDGAHMSHTHSRKGQTDPARRLSRLFRELHAAVRGERSKAGGDLSLSGAFRRFAQSAREEGVSAERVVIAAKRAYRAWVPMTRPNREDQLARLISVSIGSYYAREHNDHVQGHCEMACWSSPDAA
jgi:hypothetical protein